jgi:hypothetical protein
MKLIQTILKRAGRMIGIPTLLFLIVWSNSLSPAWSQMVVAPGTTCKVASGTTLLSAENLVVNSTAILNNAGTLVLKKSFTNNNVGSNSIGTGTAVFSGNANQSISGQNIIQNLTLNNANGLTIGGNTIVNGTLALTNGNLSLGSSNLLLGTSASVSGTPSSGKMIVATGTGELRKSFTSGFTGSFTWPVGDATGTMEYSPVTLNFASGNFASGNYVGVKLDNSAYPGSAGNYIKRFWTLSQNGITTPVFNPMFQYLPADVMGNESQISCKKIDPPTAYYNTANALLHQLSATGISVFGVFTGGQAASLAIFNVSGGGSYCAGGNGLAINLSGSEVGVSYTLLVNGVATNTMLAGTGNPLNFGNLLIAGVYTVSASNTSISATMAGSATITVTPMPSAAGAITGNIEVCAGQSVVTYSVLPVSNADSYIWTLPAGASGSSTSNSITVTFGATAVSGNISVKGHNACGDGPAAAQPINVHETFVANAGNDQIIFSGNSATLSASVTGVTGPYTYAWSNGENTQTTVVNPTSNTTYTVTITSSYGCTAVDDVLVTVLPPVLPLTVSLPVVNGCPGNLVIPVSVANFLSVASISLRFSYNNAVLAYTGYQNAHPALSSGVLLVNNSNSKVQMAWFSVIPATIGAGTLIELKFTTVSGVSPLTWDVTTPGACEFTDISNILIASSFVNGNIMIANCSNFEGNMTYDNSVSTPMTTTKVFLKLGTTKVDSVYTNTSGNYLFTGLANGIYNTNGATTKAWGGVNSADALIILKHFVGQVFLTGIRLEAADVDGSGYVNSSDALLIAKRFIGLVQTFPVGDWLFQKLNFEITGTGNINQNMKALCYGDVDGSYLPGAKSEPTIQLESEGFVSLPNTSVFEVPFRIREKSEVGSMSLVINIPQENIEVIDVMAADRGNIFFSREESGLRVAWYNLQPMQLNAGDVLFTVKCSNRNSDLAEGSLWTINPESQITDGNAITHESVRLTIPKFVNSKDQFYLQQNMPNPCTDATEISYFLPESGSVNLVIHDMLGRVVLNVVNTFQDAGLHHARISTSSLLPGLYTYALNVKGSSQEFSKTLRMLIER